MEENNNKVETFERICSRFSIWIIEYRSSTYEMPIFLVWYTDSDENSTDRLLTFNTGQIFASDSLSKIKETAINNLKEINAPDNFNFWLDSFECLMPIENCIYDVNSICSNIKKDNLDIETIEGLANFINLFDDYINQDGRNEYLSIYRENDFIDTVWNYFYDSIFFPRFNDSEKFKKWDRPELVIDKTKLLDGVQVIRQEFEQKIKPIF